MALSLLEVELISTLAEDLRVLLFPPRLTPAPGTIGDTLNSRRALHQEDGFREEEEEERLRNARPAKERKRERGGGKGTAFSTVKEKERFFFRSCCRLQTMAAKCLFFQHTVSLLFSTKRETYSPSGDYKPSPFSRPTNRPTNACTHSLPLCFRARRNRERERERERLAFHREKTPDQRVSRFVNRSTRCNSTA